MAQKRARLVTGKIWHGVSYGPGDEGRLPDDFPDGPWLAGYAPAEESTQAKQQKGDTKTDPKTDAKDAGK